MTLKWLASRKSLFAGCSQSPFVLRAAPRGWLGPYNESCDASSPDMIDHTRAAEYVLERVRFTHETKEYSGRGLLTWDPEKGIHIQAFLDQSLPQANPFAALGLVEVEDATDARPIRLAGRGFGHAIVPNVFSHDLQSYLHEGRLSIRP